MLRSLAYVLKGGLSEHMDTVIEGIKRCLKDKSQVGRIVSFAQKKCLLSDEAVRFDFVCFSRT